VIDNGGELCIGGSRDFAVNGMNPGRETMRSSRIMAIILCLCFTFAGSFALAQDENIVVERGNRTITVTVDHNNMLKKVIIRDGTAEEDVTRRANERHGDNLTDLQIKRKHGPAEDIKFVTEGTVIESGTGTCVWKFSGGHWHQYCW